MSNETVVTTPKRVLEIWKEMEEIDISMEMNDLMVPGGENFGQNDSLMMRWEELMQELAEIDEAARIKNELAPGTVWTDPAGGTHYGNDYDPARDYE